MELCFVNTICRSNDIGVPSALHVDGVESKALSRVSQHAAREGILHFCLLKQPLVCASCEEM
jgi:hypothetical protein